MAPKHGISVNFSSGIKCFLFVHTGDNLDSLMDLLYRGRSLETDYNFVCDSFLQEGFSTPSKLKADVENVEKAE